MDWEQAERYEGLARTHAREISEMEQARCELEQAHAQAISEEREASGRQAVRDAQQVTGHGGALS